MTIDTACSCSLVAFHQTCQSIRTRETAVALVAGISLHLHKTHCLLTGTSGIPHRSAVPRSPQCAALRCRLQDGGAERWPVSIWQVAAPGCERRHLSSSSGQVPVPDSDTVGLPAELEILTYADFDPVLGGLNVTPIVQVAPAASGAEQLLLTTENDGWFVPVSCQPMADSVVVPVLCTVIVCAALVVPTA